MRKRKLKKLLKRTVRTVRALAEHAGAVDDLVQDLAADTAARRGSRGRRRLLNRLDYLAQNAGKLDPLVSTLWSAERVLDNIFARREEDPNADGTGSPDTGNAGRDADPGA